MTATYTCIADCGEPLTAAEAVIVGEDITDYPAVVPTNVYSHKGCVDQARRVIAQAQQEQERGTK